jgi:hypothetical protein
MSEENDKVLRITPELRAELEEALRESEAMKNMPFTMVGPIEYAAFTDKPVIAIRQMDSLGRRHTNFCEVSVSPGLNAVEFAARIAAALAAT